ncbi:unnamed protein product [Caenorhabditis sp. 36 PRJEB53466]|nr:unnamed protein product [Caenorhabditis sp. 36 PRJEB53466]
MKLLSVFLLLFFVVLAIAAARRDEELDLDGTLAPEFDGKLYVDTVFESQQSLKPQEETKSEELKNTV